MTDSNIQKYNFFSIEDKKSVERILKTHFGMRTLYDYDYEDEDGNIIELFASDTEFVQENVLAVFDKNKYRWEKLFETMNQEYDILNNLQMTITTDNNSTDNTITKGNSLINTTGSSTETPNLNDTTSNYVNAYDTTTPSLDNKSETVSSGTDKVDSNNSTNNTNSRTTDNESVSHGDVVQTGRTTTPQELIQKERSLANISLLDEIATEIADAISYQVY